MLAIISFDTVNTVKRKEAPGNSILYHYITVSTIRLYLYRIFNFIVSDLIYTLLFYGYIWCCNICLNLNGSKIKPLRFITIKLNGRINCNTYIRHCRIALKIICVAIIQSKSNTAVFTNYIAIRNSEFAE